MNRCGLWIVLCLMLAGSMSAMATPAEPFFKAPRLAQSSLSPDGQLVVLEVNEQGQTLIEAVVPATLKSYVLTAVGATDISRFRWLGPTTFLFSIHVPELSDWRYVIGKITLEDGVITGSEFELFNSEGSLVDPIADQDEFMLFARGLELYRYPLTRRGKLHNQFKSRFLADRQPPAPGLWLADRSHEVRLVIEDESVALEGDTILIHNHVAPDNRLTATDDDGEPIEKKSRVHQFWYFDSSCDCWKKTARLDAGFQYMVIGFESDDRHVLMISDYDRDTTAVMRFDALTGTFVETLFEADGVDVVGAGMDRNGQLDVVSYREHGQLTQVFISPQGKALSEKLNGALGSPVKQVYRVDSSLDERWQLTRVSGASQSGKYYYFDTRSGDALEIGSHRPWLAELTTSDVRVISEEREGELPIEGYLLMPRDHDATTRAPLVVIPHGGPIGIRSDSRFDPTAQYLAANGFAVLKVNFRGSSGFGRQFALSARGQWGKGIEDDIERLVELTLRDHPIDAQRICAYGASYGGYSSLMLSLRNPQRYRCSAAMAAPTDTQLMFTASDWMLDQELVAKQRLWVGDPLTEQEQMRAQSPVYRAAEFSRPLLIAQGGEDYRVDAEHYRRLTLMLDLHDKPYETAWYPQAGHGFDKRDDAIDFHQRLLEFLDRHIGQASLAPSVEDGP